jgi:hypothetical protein
MSESNELTGKVHHIGEVQTFPSGFSKRVLVIQTEEKYPQTILVEFAKEKASLLDKLTIGQEVTVYYNLRGNEYKNKFYVNLSGWKIAQVGTPDTSAPDPVETVQAVMGGTVEEEEEGLPF